MSRSGEDGRQAVPFDPEDGSIPVLVNEPFGRQRAAAEEKRAAIGSIPVLVNEPFGPWR